MSYLPQISLEANVTPKYVATNDRISERRLLGAWRSVSSSLRSARLQGKARRQFRVCAACLIQLRAMRFGVTQVGAGQVGMEQVGVA